MPGEAPRGALRVLSYGVQHLRSLKDLRRSAGSPKASALVDETIRQVEANGDLCYMPELLRVKGGLLLSMPQPGGDEAETCFMQSLELSRRQGARAWELRTATDLAALLAAQGRSSAPGRFCSRYSWQFVEGLDTADLKAAERLLATLG